MPVMISVVLCAIPVNKYGVRDVNHLRLFPWTEVSVNSSLFFYLSRVARFLPILQVEVCFLRLPPGFPAVPHYFNHVSVGVSPTKTRHLYHKYHGFKCFIFIEIDDLRPLNFCLSCHSRADGNL